MTRCTRCGLPETYETIEFDDFGVCNICHQFAYKSEQIDWSSRKQMLDELIEQYRKYDYDRIIPSWWKDPLSLRIIRGEYVKSLSSYNLTISSCVQHCWKITRGLSRNLALT